MFNNTNAPKRLASVQQIPSVYPAFSQASIRWLIFNEESNGFNSCVIRLGRKVLIDLDAFESWVDLHKAVTGV